MKRMLGEYGRQEHDVETDDLAVIGEQDIGCAG